MADEQQVIDKPAPKQIIAPGYTFGTITDQIATVVLTKKTPIFWFATFAVGIALLLLFLLAVAILFTKGLGIWGLRSPTFWAWDITNFVWWVGIGHAGTLISAILLLLNQRWRNSINRFAEAMTIFAVACAGMFPILHLGRPWLMYWLFPYPNTMGIEPNFRSPLVWDVFAVSTYATVSALFWFVGLIPDLATLRDRSNNRFLKFTYGILAMGWRGSAKHWSIYETASLLLAGLATPLVLSVHTVVSFDFTIGIVPGWHSTFFPPYFVAGAIYSGFAMVLALAIPLRAVYGLQGLITDTHLDYCGKVMMATGLIVGYAYILEAFLAWYSGNVFEQAVIANRMFGPYRLEYWVLVACNVIAPNALWFTKIRRSPVLLFIWSLIVLVGMWLERFVIIVSSLAQDNLPGSWRLFESTRWDWATYLGSIGLFLFLFFLFIRLLPMISIFEVRTLLPQAKVEEEARG
ncbi:MAG TPA: NrfD/PsrC family molybdoenzyme membrane anchor subunit [Verrucomicrobiae bacterium]|nr:NrfD/PsrC family molybdoenzyme membrane anchor subunit [Myxococcota bacterium]HXK02864.1 NrfD/PsrC family molybdoenzyme membrane anchor subunit [Verrucomicrobiae bacterium]